MNDVLESGRPRLRIEKPRLLLVEGRDEVNVFKALMKHCLGGGSDMQVVDAGGKDQFPRRMRAIRTAPKPSPLRSIGVVRDANGDARGSFRSVCGSLRNVGYEPPPVHGEFSGASPPVGVFIAPDGVQPGAIETLCRRSVEGKAASACADEYMECLKNRGAMQSSNIDKSFAHAYPASMPNPVARVGEGALSGVWNFESPAFEELSRFLHRLSQAGS